MKRYYVIENNKPIEISEKEATEIAKKNEQYINSSDMEDWYKCKFILTSEVVKSKEK